MIKAVIFDMDGVIVDSEPIHFLTADTVLRKYGKRNSPELNSRFIGVAEDIFWSNVVSVLGIKENYQKLMKDKAREYKKRLSHECASFPGALELIKKLKNEKGIASSSSREEINIVLTSLGIKDNFSVIVSGDDIEHSKPHPEIYLMVAKKMGETPENCLVVEDAINGVKAAKAAGMTCVGVTNSFSQRQLTDGGADYVVQSLGDFNMEWLK